jgi:hypothetical protein
MRAIPRIVLRSLSALYVLASAHPTTVAAQPAEKTLLQLEIGDSLGLPLPNAELELYTYVEGGLFREWIPVEPAMLGVGIHLLRFSHDGFRPTVFSVPLRHGARVSLRVRLLPVRPAAADLVEASEVRALGLELDGRTTTDIIGGRRVLDREDVDRAKTPRIAEILQRAKGTGLQVLPFTPGTSQVSTRPGIGRALCREAVMINGDPTLRLSFSRFEELYGTSEPEAVEIVIRGKAIPYTYRRSEGDCTMLLVWLKGR